MAEGLLRRALDARDNPGRVLSAGITYDDHPASEGSVRAMAARGIDISAHRSRIMWPALLRSADLIATMARAHVREAAVMAPERFDRMFTLKSLVREGMRVGSRDNTPLEQWLAKVADGRTASEFLGDSAEDDVKDPIGRPQKVYDACAAELDDLVSKMAWLLWGPVPGEELDEGFPEEIRR